MRGDGAHKGYIGGVMVQRPTIEALTSSRGGAGQHASTGAPQRIRRSRSRLRAQAELRRADWAAGGSRLTSGTRRPTGRRFRRSRPTVRRPGWPGRRRRPRRSSRCRRRRGCLSRAGGREGRAGSVRKGGESKEWCGPGAEQAPAAAHAPRPLRHQRQSGKPSGRPPETALTEMDGDGAAGRGGAAAHAERQVALHASLGGGWVGGWDEEVGSAYSPEALSPCRISQPQHRRTRRAQAARPPRTRHHAVGGGVAAPQAGGACQDGRLRGALQHAMAGAAARVEQGGDVVGGPLRLRGGWMGG